MSIVSLSAVFDTSGLRHVCTLLWGARASERIDCIHIRQHDCTTTLMGMASTLQSLCGQAYGAKQYHPLGNYLQRELFVLYVVCIPISFLLWFIAAQAFRSRPRALGDGGAVCSLLGSSSPCCLTTVISHVPLSWILIYKLCNAFRGASIATGISIWINVLLVVLYVKFSPTCSRTWTSFSPEAFNDIPAFFKLAITSAPS